MVIFQTGAHGMAGRCGSMFNAWNSHNKAAILLNFDGLSSAIDVPALINIPYSIYYVFILAEELHYSNIKLHIKYQFHTKRKDVF